LLNVNCRLEWVLVDLALNAYGKVGVSLYDTLGDQAVGASELPKPTHLGANSNIYQSICKVPTGRVIMI